MGFLKRFFKSVLATAVLLGSMTVASGQTGVAPNVRFLETDQSLPDGLWRIRLDGDVFTIDKNTNASNNFATAITAMSIAANGDVTIPNDLFVTGSATVTVDTSVTGDLVVTGTIQVVSAGPHAISGTPSGVIQLIISDTFISDGSSSILSGIYNTSTLVGLTGTTTSIAGATFTSSLQTQTETESVADIAQVIINEPFITDNLTGGGLITRASTLLITGAPDEGVDNYALRVGAGLTSLQGNVELAAASELDWGGDVKLFRDGPWELALRDGTNDNFFYIYATFTDDMNYERLALYAGGQSDFFIEAQTAGTGQDLVNIDIISNGTNSHVSIIPNSASTTNIRFIETQMQFLADNTVDIGSIAGGRPDNIYVASSIFAGLADTSPIDALTFDSPDLVGAGQRDSHGLLLTGQGHDGSQNDADWKMFVDVTSNAGASKLLFQSRINAAGFDTKIELFDTGNLVIGDNETQLYGLTIGDNPQGHSPFWMTGSFTSNVAQTFAAIIATNMTLTGGSGDIISLSGMSLDNTIITQAAVENIPIVAQLIIQEPNITDNLTGAIANAASLIIADAPTEASGTGSVNAAIIIGTSQTGIYDAIVIDQADRTGDGNDDSGAIIMTGVSFNTATPHDSDWKTFVDVTNNVGASTWTLQSRVDAASFADRFTITDGGTVTFGALTLSNQPLGVGSGGTGRNTLIDGGILLGNGVSGIIAMARGTAGQMLIGSTSGDPVMGTLIGTSAEVDVTTGDGTLQVGLPDNVDIDGTLDVTGNTTLDSTFTLATVGPHAFGGGGIGNVQIGISGTFTSAGGGQTPSALSIDSIIVGLLNNDSRLEAMSIFAEIQAQTSGTIADVANLTISEPFTSITGGGSITNEQNLLLDRLPLAGDNRYGIRILGYNTLADAAIIFDSDALSGDGQRDSEAFQMRAKAFESATPHNVDWKNFVDVTANTGTSTWTLQNRIDGAGFVNKLTVADNGLLTVAGNAVINGQSLNMGAGSATTGTIAVPYFGTMVWRNADDSGNLSTLDYSGVLGAETFEIGAFAAATIFGVSIDATDLLSFGTGNVDTWFMDASQRVRIGALGSDGLDEAPPEDFTVRQGNIEVLDIGDLALESLNDGNFSSFANWSDSDDWNEGTLNYTYLHSVGSGQLSQVSANQAISPIALSKWWEFTYTVSASTSVGALACFFPSEEMSLNQLNLNVATNGTRTVVFEGTEENAADFIIECTSDTGGDGFTLDDVTLKEVIGGDIIVNGKITGGGTGSSGLKLDGPGNATFDRTVTIDDSGAEAFLVRKSNDSGDVFTVDASTDTVLVGTLTAVNQTFETLPETFTVVEGNIEVLDTGTLGGETLQDADFGEFSQWAEVGDFSEGSENYIYLHSGGTGTLTQTAAQRREAGGENNRWYSFSYTVSSVTAVGALTLDITTAFGASVVTLDVSTAGTRTTIFQSDAAASAADFVFSATSNTASDGFTLDDPTLKEIIGGDIVMAGSLTGGGANGGLFVDGDGSTVVENNLEVNGGPTTSIGSNLTIQSATAILATTSGTVVTATNLIPAGSFVVGIVTRVNDLVTGPAGYDVGDGTDVDRWGNSIAVASDTTSDITDFQSSALTLFPAANDVVITSDGVAFTAGNIRVIVYYMSLTAPTVD